MQSSASSLPEYDTPPVVEVVFGVQFKDLKELKSPHMGAFWEKIGRADFPECEEMSPLVHVVETYDQPVSKSSTVTIEKLDLPPLPRLFFITKEKNNLIQLQRDRFLQNWRKLQEGTEYPRYKQLFPQFLKAWQLFNDFVEELNIGQLEPDQYELTYINHIRKGDGWTDLSDIERVFPEFQCKVGDRFLVEPEQVAWRRIYRLPKDMGRLRVSMQQATVVETKSPVLALNLTARGFAKSGLSAWFDMAHEWIVKGFTDLTGPDIQKSVWKRKDE